MGASSEIIIYPDGTLNEDGLDNLLWEAHVAKLKPKDRLSVLRERRVTRFDPDNPTYETVKRKLTVQTLQKWYQGVTGRIFDPHNRPSCIRPIFMLVHNPKTRASCLVDIGS